jgi:hypothetical protein
VPADILYKLVLMVTNCEGGNFKAANDFYISTAIGNSAWPIGLTMVSGLGLGLAYFVALMLICWRFIDTFRCFCLRLSTLSSSCIVRVPVVDVTANNTDRLHFYTILGGDPRALGPREDQQQQGASLRVAM